MKPLWEMYRRSRPSGGTPAPWPSDRSSIPEFIRKRLLDDLDERKDADTAADEILELHQKDQRGAGSKPPYVGKSPSIVPDAQGEASATTDKDSSGPREDDADCEKQRQEARAFCLEAREKGLKGFFGISHLKKPRSIHWDVDKCEKGQISERCGGYPLDRPDGKPKKRK